MPVDVLIVSLGSTAGLRAADRELQTSLERAGARAAVVAAPLPTARLPTLALGDLVLAWRARERARRALAELRPRAVLYSTTTTAALWSRPGAIRFDACANGNRPGRAGVWQRPVERARLAEAPLLLPWSAAALAEGPARHAPAIVLPVPIDVAARAQGGERDIAAITYAANPHKKGLDRVLAAFARARRDYEELVVVGAPTTIRMPGVRCMGLMDRERYRALQRRCRVYVTAPRREDYGIAQLEALADGCALVTTPAPGPYVALPIARGLDSRLVGEDLAAALRSALDAPTPGYAERARAALSPYSSTAVDRIVAEQVLPVLLERAG